VQTQSAVCVPTLTTVHALPESSLTEDSLLKKVVHASRAVNADTSSIATALDAVRAMGSRGESTNAGGTFIPAQSLLTKFIQP